jgi:hypothetical protein
MPRINLIAIASILISANLFGCAIVNRSDRFGADLDVGLGGIVSTIADVHVKASVGFAKTHFRGESDGQEKSVESDSGDDILGLRGFL